MHVSMTAPMPCRVHACQTLQHPHLVKGDVLRRKKPRLQRLLAGAELERGRQPRPEQAVRLPDDGDVPVRVGRHDLRAAAHPQLAHWHTRRSAFAPYLHSSANFVATYASIASWMPALHNKNTACTSGLTDRMT